jgi:hypothetical protein
MDSSLRGRRLLFLLVLVCLVFVATNTRAEWVLIDSTYVTDLVPAGEECCLSLQYPAHRIDVSAAAGDLTPDAEAAVALAPGWLRTALRENLLRLNETDQNLYAGLILSAEPAYVDEICFEVAHVAPETLGGSMAPGVLVENVESLYATDDHLAYADIVDYAGEDYYSTISYRVLEEGQIREFELPRDVYYWYVVHPKLHKETPNYINPDTGYPAAPPTGVFWRDFLMNHSDDGYPLLRTYLDTCSVLWKSEQNMLDNGAVGAVTRWIQDVMTFQSHAHHNQPARIYRLHVGTCSVHSYLTSAAARAALIPAVVDVMYSDNHKINEFWDRRWIAWEPVNTYIDYPEGYENWGWDVAAAFNWRGDSFIWDATERYTEVCTLNVSVTGSEGRPVDGARVKILSYPCVSWGATAGWTDRDGQKQFLLGDDRTFLASVQSDIGNYPPTGTEVVISGSQPGVSYQWNVALPGAVPAPRASPDSLPGSPTDDYRLVVEYDLPAEILHGSNIDDGNRFSEPNSPGYTSFFICDQENLAQYAAGDSFRAFEIREETSRGSVEFVLPSPEPWHAVFSNRGNLALTQELEVTARLYARPTGVASDGEHDEPPTTLTLYPSRPNPFSPETRIAFRVSLAGRADVTIYDVRGEKVRTLVSGFRRAGEHAVVWDGRDDTGRAVSSGVYFLSVSAGNCRRVGKLLLIR